MWGIRADKTFQLKRKLWFGVKHRRGNHQWRHSSSGSKRNANICSVDLPWEDYCVIDKYTQLHIWLNRKLFGVSIGLVQLGQLHQVNLCLMPMDRFPSTSMPSSLFSHIKQKKTQAIFPTDIHTYTDGERSHSENEDHRGTKEKGN